MTNNQKLETIARIKNLREKIDALEKANWEPNFYLLSEHDDLIEELYEHYRKEGNTNEELRQLVKRDLA
jgi:hypothetical protein